MFSHFNTLSIFHLKEYPMRKKEAAQLSKDARIESVFEVLEILMLEPDGEMMLHGSGICFSTHALSKDR